MKGAVDDATAAIDADGLDRIVIGIGSRPKYVTSHRRKRIALMKRVLAGTLYRAKDLNNSFVILIRNDHDIAVVELRIRTAIANGKERKKINRSRSTITMSQHYAPVLSLRRR